MPTVYLRKDLYDTIIQKHEEPSNFVNKTVEEALRQMVSKGEIKSKGKEK